MADEYIERGALLAAYDKEHEGEPGRARKLIEDATAADVVQVVRCKDCKHGTRLVCDLAGNAGIVCRHGNVVRGLDWFCADGAKMENIMELEDDENGV